MTYKETTIMEAELCNSKEAADDYFIKCIMNGWRGFGILVEDISLLHSVEEYIKLCPGVIDIDVERLVKFHNGIWLEFDTITCKEDVEYIYAIKTGDTSYLNSTELQVYLKLLAIMAELKLEEKSDIEKIMAVHDYLVLNTAYDVEAAAAYYAGILEYDLDSHFVEGTILNRKAVCSGYAYTFALFMNAYDIPCEYVSNDTHGWNLVKVEDSWYHIDITWDDPVPDRPGNVIYTHFMMTDEEIRKLESHESWSCECETYRHDCKDSSYRIYPYSEYLCETEEAAEALIQAQENKGKILFVYPAEGALTEEILLNKATARYGNIIYYPSKRIGDSHLVLEIVLEHGQ